MRIEQFFRESKRFVAWPLRVSWTPTEEETKILVWAPKSLFKHAVQRNHLRRLMREAYRLNQNLLGDAHYTIAFNYLDKEEQPYIVIEKAVCKALKKISGK
jgi:ribonuclease P protein component